MADTKIPYKPELGGFTSKPSSSGLDSALGGLFSPADLAQLRANAMAAAAGSGTAGKGKAGKPAWTEYPSVSSDTDANAKITSAFQNLLGRDPNADELNFWRPKLIKAQKANAAKQTYKRTGAGAVQATVTGLNEAQWLKEKLSAVPRYQEELKKAALTPRNLAQKAADKQAYIDALSQTAGDPAKITQLNQNTAYGLSLTGLKDRIQSEADKAGAVYDEADLLSWAREAYDSNYDQDPYTFKKFVDSKLKFVGAGYKGEALNTFNSLRDIALANGMDINKTFGSQLPAWIQDINKGANIETYKQRIRDIAKIGMPERIGKLLDQGVDLSVIYSPYQNLMENVLELPNGSVQLNDPTLRAAITQQGEVPLYEFERQLRNDPRWGFTNTARQQVANTTLDILRQFGFQG